MGENPGYFPENIVGRQKILDEMAKLHCAVRRECKTCGLTGLLQNEKTKSPLPKGEGSNMQKVRYKCSAYKKIPHTKCVRHS